MFVHAGLLFEHIIPTKTVSSHDLHPGWKPAEIERTDDPQLSLQLLTNWIDVESQLQQCNIVRMFAVNLPITDDEGYIMAINCDLWWFSADPTILFAVDTRNGGGMGSIVGVAPLFP